MDEVAEGVGQVFVHRRREMFPSEVGVVGFRRLGDEVVPPNVGRKVLQSLIHKDAPPLAGRKLPAVVREPVERFDVRREGPGLAGAEDRSREKDGMERHVVFGEKLHVLDIRCVIPPAAPVPLAGLQVGPLFRRGDVPDGRIEPHVEHFVLKARTRHRHPPCQIAGDAPCPHTFVKPFQGNRPGKERPLPDGIPPTAAAFRPTVRA